MHFWPFHSIPFISKHCFPSFHLSFMIHCWLFFSNTCFCLLIPCVYLTFNTSIEFFCFNCALLLLKDLFHFSKSSYSFHVISCMCLVILIPSLNTHSSRFYFQVDILIPNLYNTNFVAVLHGDANAFELIPHNLS